MNMPVFFGAACDRSLAAAIAPLYVNIQEAFMTEDLIHERMLDERSEAIWGE